MIFISQRFHSTWIIYLLIQKEECIECNVYMDSIECLIQENKNKLTKCANKWENISKEKKIISKHVVM
jgi:hypothetical protein